MKYIVFLSLFFWCCSSNIRFPLFRKESHKSTRILQTVESPINLTSILQYGYYMYISLGNSTTTPFTMMVDIGTPWTWVPSINCTNCYQSNIYPCYYQCENISESCQLDNSFNYTLEYINGSVGAYHSTEFINIGDITVNQTIYQALDIPKSFYDMYFDGILGLGLTSETSETPGLSLLENLKNSNKITVKAFSIYLASQDMQTSQDSVLILGNYSEDYNETELMKIPMYNSSYWSIKIIDAIFMDVSLNASVEVVFSTIYQSIGMPSTYYNQFFNLLLSENFSCIAGDDETQCECVPNRNISNMTIQFNDNTSITLEIMKLLRYISFEDGGNQICILPFGNTSTMSNLPEFYEDKWIFGIPFMNLYYTYFNADENFIAFAKAIPSNQIAQESLLIIYILQIIFLVIVLGIIIGYIIGYFKIKKKVLEEYELRMQSSYIEYSS